MLERVLTAAGYTVEAFQTIEHARIVLDDGAFDAAVVDEFAGGAIPLEEVRALREQYPRVPVVVTGSLLDRRGLQTLVRAGAADVVFKPFTPDEIRDAVARALARARPRFDDAREYAAAI